MAFEIIFSDTAYSRLKSLDRAVAKRIFQGISNLDSKSKSKIVMIPNSLFYKLRIGDHNVIMDIKNQNLRILLIERSPFRNL